MRPRYTKRAEADLMDISIYSQAKWGPAQAGLYLAELDDCCYRLSVTPLIGKARPSLLKGLRSFPQGRHVIYYKPTPSGIQVFRILHDRMNPTRSRLQP